MTVAALPASSECRCDTTAESQSGAKKIRTLIVDDQLLEREVMRRMLKNEEDIEIIGTSSNGKEAVESIIGLKPDLVFLDVQMPELDGFEVVSKISTLRKPVIIFVTANEEFARKAFDVQALDYLIKPCGRDRLRVALQRARGEISRKETGDLQQKLSELLAGGINVRPSVPERLAFKSGDRIRFLNLADIQWIEAAEGGVKLHLDKEILPLRDTLAMLELRLPGDRFLRISRSAIVNIEGIREMESLQNGDYAVVLRDGTQMTLTRSYREKLQHLGI
jgi:two-component system, LytTR family, response regulator